MTSSRKSETKYLSDELSNRETSDSSSICTDDTEFIDEINEPVLPNDIFVWNDMGTYNSHREIFDEDDGPQNEAKEKTEPIDIFELFFPIEFVETIVEQTNLYAQQKRASLGMVFPLRSRMNEWKNVTAEEIYVVFGFYMLMGIIQKPTIRSYFSKKDIIGTPIFNKIMTLDRFELITNFLHFVGNDTINAFEGPKKLFKIYPIIKHLNNVFQKYYLLGRNISVDESLTLWKGILSFKQFIPLKSAQFGIKTYELCESTTGYLWKFIVYTGKDCEFTSPLITQNMMKTCKIVLQLVEPLLHNGHTLWMDNFYNSVELAKQLKTWGTDCVGTLRLNRKNTPPIIKKTKLQKGEIIAKHCEAITILKWMDKKPVTMISTHHGQETGCIIKRNREVSKPVSVIDYNKNMGGVDLKDQMLEGYLLERKKMHKWYIKLFRKLLNVSILNSFIIYKRNKQQKVDHLKFRVQLVEQIFAKYVNEVQRKVPCRHSQDKNVSRLTDRHFIEKIPPTQQKAKPQKRCVVCYKRGRRKETIYWCPDCEAGLCLESCFKIYHTLENY
ncbi:piggyBac transposable element-derived protein 4-like [Onthophagus taurus]|uniref:piggyBac transposable element-derived protein 4-like n=1 Tax=Onthophagus taurus TaxID=166361 RepID=UPI0039BE4A2A